MDDLTLTIPGLARGAATRWPDRDAVVAGEARVSFAQLDARMMRCAAAFVAAGLAEGDRVALWAENSVDWIVACLGIQAAGGVLVPINTRFRIAEAAFIVARSGARFAIGASEFLGTRYADMLREMESTTLQRVVALGDPDWDAFLDGADDASRAEAERRLAALDGDALSDIMFTSGTTGEPKGAMATHGQTVRTARMWVQATTLRADDRFLVLWPFFHCSGYKAGWVANLAAGATTIPEAALDVERLLATIERERVTFLPGPPTLFQTLLADPTLDRSRLGSLRVSITGASSVAPSLIGAMREELAIPTVLTGYGLTETCGTVTMSSPLDPPERVATTCGRAIEGIEIAVFDEDGRTLPPGETGEIVVRGMNVMLGYLDDPEATAAAIDPSGWLHTGDVGTIDAAGYLAITDRIKDVFIVGGFNCYPAEIEKMMLVHPDILHVAVIGVPDARMGEVGKAHVVLTQGSALDERALVAWCQERMANFKVPRAIAFVDTLPTNATGKVQKFMLSGGKRSNV